MGVVRAPGGGRARESGRDYGLVRESGGGRVRGHRGYADDSASWRSFAPQARARSTSPSRSGP